MLNFNLIKENIQLSDEIENNQIDVLKSKFERFMEQSSCDFSIQNQNTPIMTKQESNQNIHLSKSCTNLTFESISEPDSIKSEPSITNTPKPIQFSTPFSEGNFNCNQN